MTSTSSNAMRLMCFDAPWAVGVYEVLAGQVVAAGKDVDTSAWPAHQVETAPVFLVLNLQAAADASNEEHAP